MASHGKSVRLTRKRVSNGASVANSVSITPAEKQEDSVDYLCPICFDLMREVYMTRCGHSYCFECLKQSLDLRSVCPKCSGAVDQNSDIFPNFKLNEVVQKYRSEIESGKKRRVSEVPGLGSAAAALLGDKEVISLTNINTLLEFLQKKKVELEGETSYSQHQILLHFLNKVKLKKDQELQELRTQLEVVGSDVTQVQSHVEMTRSSHSNGLLPESSTAASNGDGPSSSKPETFNGARPMSRQTMAAFVANSKQRINQHFDDLEHCYLTARLKSPGDEGDFHALDEFRESLVHFTRYTGFRVLASLNYTSDIYTSSSIVSSIEFNRDCDFFAIAGVTKKIKVYDYESVTGSGLFIHHPLGEMVCTSKISSVAWSTYHQSMLASSDYEGNVTLWDVGSSSRIKVFQEHEKRCWCVDFNSVDPKLLASGSDDTKVKLWHSNMNNSITSLEGKANICCVKFKPNSRYHLAFGSADHCVHYYDLRNAKQAVSVFKGHKKAVSYTKFLNEEEMVSASTDSQLKLWNIPQISCTGTFKGHTNEKNFVGLATDGTYIACGSESNALFIYYKGLSKHILSYKFETNSPEKETRRDDDNADFVSAVCWRPKSNVIAAANSQGTVKLLELV